MGGGGESEEGAAAAPHCRQLCPVLPACLAGTFLSFFLFNSVFFFHFFFLKKKQNRAGQNFEKQTRSPCMPPWEAYFFSQLVVWQLRASVGLSPRCVLVPV